MKIINIILIFIIFIIIIILIKNKYINENFSIIKISSDIESAKKANLDKIIYIKGNKGYTGDDGLKGDIGNTGRKGNIGINGNDGIDSGPIIFIDKNKNELGRYQPTGISANFKKVYVDVPDGIKGNDGLIGPIIFIKEDSSYESNFKFKLNNNNINIPISEYKTDDILGSYFPPKNSKASNIEPIIIRVPNGLQGEQGINAKCDIGEKGDDGPRGKSGIQGDPGEQGNTGPSGNNGINGGEDKTSAFDDIKINNKICWKNNEKKICIDYQLLDAIKTDLHQKKFNKNYIPPLIRRENRLKKELCNTNTNNSKYNILINELHETLKINNPNVDISTVFLKSNDCNNI